MLNATSIVTTPAAAAVVPDAREEDVSGFDYYATRQWRYVNGQYTRTGTAPAPAAPAAPPSEPYRALASWLRGLSGVYGG